MPLDTTPARLHQHECASCVAEPFPCLNSDCDATEPHYCTDCADDDAPPYRPMPTAPWRDR